MTLRAPEKVALVVQRWAPDIVGGAESLAWYYASLLKSKYDVDLLTTRAKDATTWANDLPEGEEVHDLVRVLRFPVTIGRSPYWQKLHNLLVGSHQNLKNQPERRELDWPPGLQEEWIRSQGPHSAPLLEFIRAHQDDYKVFLFVTYLYSPTYFGALSLPTRKSIFIPALHDEPPAYLPAFRRLAWHCGKIFWNTPAEAELGRRFWGDLPGRVVSMGIERDQFSDEDIAKEAKEAREKIGGDFVLYSGRIDPGKGCARLLDYFERYRDESNRDLRLVFTGNLQMQLPGREYLLYKGFVPELEKLALMEAARAFIMPSPFESLSLVTLEAMSRKTPVLVDGENPVLRDHIELSGGGLCFENYNEFQNGLSRLLDEKDLARDLGAKGLVYVKERYDNSRIKEILLEEIDSLAVS